jgi:hypothetical protein
MVAIKRKIHPRYMVALVIGILVVIFYILLAIYMGIKKNDFGEFLYVITFLLEASLLGVPLLTWIIQDDFGYQVYWDEEAIYMRAGSWRFSPIYKGFRDVQRPPGLFWWLSRGPLSKMRYEDMIKLSGDPDKRLGGEARYTPEAFLYLTGKVTPPGLYKDMIAIGLDYFHRDSLLDFMENLKGKRPDLVPKGWTKQLAKRAANDR